MMNGATTVLAIIYIAVSTGIVASAAIVWLSRVLKKDQWSVDP